MQHGDRDAAAAAVDQVYGELHRIAANQMRHERPGQQAQQQEQQFRSYVQETAGSANTADQLAKLADLRDQGVITAEEFDREKAKILA